MSRDQFDEDQYKCLEVVGEVTVEGKAAVVQVALWQYGDNPPKVKVQRKGVKKDGTEFSRDVGGMTAEEAASVWPLLKVAAERLGKRAK